MTTREETLQQAKDVIARGERDAAIALLRPIATAGDPDALFMLGSRFFSNLDLVPIDEALRLLAQAADAGHAEAAYEIALFRSADEGRLEYGPPESEREVELLIRAGELGSADAQYDLGALYATGDWAGPKDAVEARRWYLKAASRDTEARSSTSGTCTWSAKAAAWIRPRASDGSKRRPPKTNRKR
jgi:uncharacterized protein